MQSYRNKCVTGCSISFFVGEYFFPDRFTTDLVKAVLTSRLKSGGLLIVVAGLSSFAILCLSHSTRTCSLMCWKHAAGESDESGIRRDDRFWPGDAGHAALALRRRALMRFTSSYRATYLHRNGAVIRRRYPFHQNFGRHAHLFASDAQQLTDVCDHSAYRREFISRLELDSELGQRRHFRLRIVHLSALSKWKSQQRR